MSTPVEPIDGGVDGAGEDQEADDDDKDAEDDAQQLRTDHVHGQAGDQVVLVDGDADRVRDEHDGQQGARAR